MKFFFYFFYSGVFLILLIFISGLISYSFFLSDYTKSSPFECGFISFSVLMTPFSMSFFVVSLVFLLFDVEILLVCLFPFVSSLGHFLFFYTWVVILIILTATFYEWSKGVLVWL